MINKIKSVSQNEYFYAVITRTINAILGLASTILLARFLGTEIKGQVSYIQSISTTAAIVFGLGIHHAYSFFRKKSGEKYLKVYMRPVSLIMLIYVFLSGIICALTYNNNIVLYSCLMIPILVFSTITGYVLLIECPNKINSRRNFFVLVQILYLIICLYVIRPRAYLGVIGLLIPEVLIILFTIKQTHWSFKISMSDIKELKILVKYGFFPMLALLMTTLNYKIDILMLRSFKNIDYSMIGIYSIGISIAEKALLISDAVKEILLSKLTKGKGYYEVALVMRICFPLAISFALVIAIIGKPTISILFGKSYSDAYMVTVIHLIGTVFMVFFKMITQYNIVNGKQKYNVLMLSVSIVINVIFNIILVPLLGINGAAVASTIGYILCAFVYIIYFSRVSGIKIFDLIIIKKDDISSIKSLFFRRKTK